MDAIENKMLKTASYPQNHIDFEARRSGLGGSDMAAIMGISPFKTAYEVYLEKVEGKKNDLPSNQKALWGTLLEDLIAKHYEQLKGIQLFCTSMFKHKKYPFLIAHPDRITLEGRGVEIKAVGEHTKHLWGESGSTMIPEYYYSQIAHYMLVLDHSFWDVAVLIGGQEFRTYTFERDKEFDGILIEEGTKFWENHIEKKCPPPIDYAHPNAKEFIKRKFNLVSEEVVDLSDEFLQMADLLEETKERLKNCQKLKDEMEAKILYEMQNAGIGRLSDGRVFTRKLVERRGYIVPDSKYTTLTLKKGV